MKNPNFFPLPSNVAGLHIATGERNRYGTQTTKRNEPRWHEIGAERNAARMVAEHWRDAALADGWVMEPTYVHEDVNRAATLKMLVQPQKIFKVHIISRPNILTGDNWSLGGGELNCWGPDDLTIPVPLIYPGRQYFIDALVTCPHCQKGPNRSFFTNAADMDITMPRDWIAARDPVETKRYSFSGRTCKECSPALTAVHERPGWND